MKDKDICEYISCPYYLYYKKIGDSQRCFDIGPCEKIAHKKMIWRISPLSRPGVVFTPEQEELVKQYIQTMEIGKAQQIILDKLEEE